MLIVRMVYLKEMPSYENVLESLKNNNSNQEKNTELELNQKKISSNNEQKEVKKISKDQIKNITQTKPSSFSTTIEAQTINSKYEKISSFEELIFMSSQKKEIQLKYDLENNVNLIKFSDGKIDIGFNTNLEKNFVRNLSEKLFEWTGSRWVITLTKKEGAKTYSEQKNLEKKKIIEEEKKGEIYKEFKNVFSDGELLEVKKKD